MNQITKADVDQILISKIVVGIRRRKKLGNLRSLARSIEARGLFHPIIVRNGNELVSGQRRLEACKRLGWTTIAARSIESMTDEELRAIEFDENVERLPFADFESSKQRLASIRQTEADLKAEAEKTGGTISTVSKGLRGPARRPGSRKDIARTIGLSPKEQRNVEKHVAIGERYPFLQKNGFVMHQVLEADHELDKLPESERGLVASLLDQDAIPPKKAMMIIRNMAQMPASARKSIYKLGSSDDEHERITALTKAAALPPPVDPGLTKLQDARAALIQAAKYCRTDSFIEPLRSARDVVIELEKQFTDYVRRNHG